MPNQELKVSGDDNFIIGADSYTLSTRLDPGTYVMGVNVINRGGIVQTRPGSKTLLDLPRGRLQGVTLFKPTNGTWYLVFAVDGKVYASSHPFNTYVQIPNIQFSPYSKYVSWASCVQFTENNAAGVIQILDEPKNVLMMADGYTRSAFWDGTISRHLDPTKNETPVGLWMHWSNNRLWISRGTQIFASDIGNPLGFTEATYINEARAFYLTGDCTGISETANSEGIMCFTADSVSFIKASIQDRTLWLQTPQFQQTLLNDVGCVAPRSIVQQYGLLWWYSAGGLVNQNDAERVSVSSRFDVQDDEMFESKASMSFDLTTIAGAAYENFLLHAVPSGNAYNTRVHVLDQSPFAQKVNSWPGYWTGWNVVEFAAGNISGQRRVFGCTTDDQGNNSIWEFFLKDKTDNGIPITCWIASRTNMFENRDYKQFRYIELELCNVAGDVSITAGIKGLRGAFQPVLKKEIKSTIGQVYYAENYGYNANELAGSRLQTRIVRSQDGSAATECNSSCVESDISGLIDKGFSAAIAWSGSMGLSAYRMFVQSIPQAYQGTCEQDEEENNLLSPYGCGIEGLFIANTGPWPEYWAKATFTQTIDSTTVDATRYASSYISQADANRKAMKTAQWVVGRELGTL